MFVGVDVGGTKTAVLVTNSSGHTLGRTQRPTDSTRLIPFLIELIAATITTYGGLNKPVTAIALGFPGLVDHDAGTVELATNLQINEPLEAARLLTQHFGCPVIIENDVRLATLGVYARYQTGNLVYLSLGTGVAAGIMQNHQLLRGQNNIAGEIGQVVMDASGLRLEQQISGPAIVAEAAAHSIVTTQASTLFRMAHGNHPGACQVVRSVCQRIGRAIQWLVMMHDVDKVVLGGGVTKAETVFQLAIQAELARLRQISPLHARLLPDDKVSVLPRHFNAGLQGAIALAQQAATH